MMDETLEAIVKTWDEEIPDPIRKLLFLKCPACGKRIWNAHGAERLSYLAHYLEAHPIDIHVYLRNKKC